MDELTKKIADLSPAKRAVLNQRLQEKKAGLGSKSIISRRSEPGPARLSFAQERLWFLDQLEPNSAVYNIPLGLRLKGDLNVPALQRCLDEIVRRHEALRTRFEVADGRPLQVIESSVPLEIPLIDLSSMPEQQREAEARKLCGLDAGRPFDLKRDLMLRVRLFRLGPTDHILLLIVHHIASDGWSLGVLFPELRTLYTAFVAGQPSPLPELAVQYADFAAWQRQWMQGEVLEKQLSYWRTQLKGAPARLELPTDRPRPAVQGYHGSMLRKDLPRSLAADLKELSRAEGATLYMTLLAAFQTLLHRYTAAEDIVVGSAIAGRHHTEIERLIGFFVNTLVMRGDLSGNPSFRTLLSRTRDVALGAYAHQDVPFERLVEELQPRRDTSRPPIFQVMFVLQNAPFEAAALPGLEVTSIPLESGTAKVDLTVIVTEHDGALQTVVEYSTDLFDARTIGRMLGHFQTLLEAIVSAPDQRLSDLPLLTSPERQQLLVDWNDTRAEFPRDKCIHELFEAQAVQAPDAVAVVFGDRRLTYAELNQRANRLAHHLRKLGVGPDVPVGLCVERSLEMAVGLLAILKAGGAYVPLDASYPKERLAFMLEDTQAPVLLVQSTLLDRIPPSAARVVHLAAGVAEWAEESPENPNVAVRPENLAYIIYTSGSTGNPKGVQVPHRGVARLVFGVEYARFDAGRVFLQLAPLSFDASTLEIWGALLHGARCVIAPPGPQTPHEIGQLVRNHHVTTLWLTSSLYNAVIELNPSALSSVSELLIGGEALSPPHVQRGLRLLPQTQIINGYGPTESTTFTCCYRIPPQFDRHASSVPIGRPISNTQVYILDDRQQPVPIGVAGELYIGGDGLARGYLNRPELTAEKFVPNPFSADPNARFYRTGDVARYLPDGNIDFIGRLDQQVKIRGFRIELGEIESVLAWHPSVSEAVAEVREDIPGDKRLVAYITAKEGEPPKASELRTMLQAKLPEYMVPSAFVTLAALPLTPNGKVDRKALPAPDAGRAEVEQAYVAPRTPVEVALAGIWMETLGLEQVGIHDNFFQLGGHSLLAARMLAKAEKTLKKHAPLATIFHSPTIAALAQHFQKEQKNALDLLEPVRTTGDGAVVLCFGGGLIGHLPELVPSAHPLYWCKPEHFDGKRTRYSTIEDLAAHYCQQISVAGLKGPYVLCGFSYGGLVAYETARQLYERDGASTLLFLVEPSLAVAAKQTSGLRIVHHLRHIPSVSRGQRAAYVFAKARASLQLVRRRIRQLYCSGRLAFGLPVPVSMRWPYVEDQYRQAAQRYVPQPFPGKLVLIHGAQYPSSLVDRWSALGLDEIDVNRIESTNHLDLVNNKQWVVHWADLLKLHLHQISESNNPSPAVPAYAS